MKKIKNSIIGIILIVSVFYMAPLAEGSSEEKTVSITFTSDMHSHLESAAGKGGFGKIKTTADRIKSKYENNFLLDGGDFSMGTPYQTIYKEEASELVMMGQLGYDAVAIGNHEFDYRAKGLAQMLNRAAEEEIFEEDSTIEDGEETTFQRKMPQVVLSNINWEKSLKDESSKEDGKILKEAFNNYGVEDYTIIEKDGVKMAVFGVLGENAISQAPESGVKWDNYIERSKEIVKEIKRNKEADIIVALSHSGTDDDEGSKGEDVALAKEVPEIDVIVSGHSHSTFKKAKTVGNTTIVSPGEYTNNIGHLVVKGKQGNYKVKSYKLIPLDEKVEENEEINEKIGEYKEKVNNQFFSEYGYTYDTVLANNNLKFTPIENFGKEQGEDTLGNIITDSYIYAVKTAEGQSGEKVDVVIVPQGVVRGSIDEGGVTTAEAFNVSSLGTGPDEEPGYPLVSIYLTGKELKSVAELDISMSPKMKEIRLYMSGLSYKYNNHRIFLNRSTDVRLDLGNEKYEKLDDDKLYRVVGGLYSCQMLDLVTEVSKGFISVEPKDKDGNKIEDFEKHIIYKDGKELKEWWALASYIDSFEGNEIPSYYGETQNRKVDETSFNPWKLIKQPNNFSIIVFAIVLIPIVIITGIIIYIRKRRQNRRGYGKSMFAKGGKRNVTPRNHRPRKVKKYKSKFK